MHPRQTNVLRTHRAAFVPTQCLHTSYLFLHFVLANVLAAFCLLVLVAHMEYIQGSEYFPLQTNQMFAFHLVTIHRNAVYGLYFAER